MGLRGNSPLQGSQRSLTGALLANAGPASAGVCVLRGTDHATTKAGLLAMSESVRAACQRTIARHASMLAKNAAMIVSAMIGRGCMSFSCRVDFASSVAACRGQQRGSSKALSIHSSRVARHTRGLSFDCRLHGGLVPERYAALRSRQSKVALAVVNCREAPGRARHWPMGLWVLRFSGDASRPRGRRVPAMAARSRSGLCPSHSSAASSP
jgi:hypothetical protein